MSGAIHTLGLNVEAVAALPIEAANVRPDYRVFVGKAAFGARGRKPHGRDGSPLAGADHLSFAGPMTAALVVIDGVHTLVWSRPFGRKSD